MKRIPHPNEDLLDIDALTSPFVNWPNLVTEFFNLFHPTPLEMIYPKMNSSGHVVFLLNTYMYVSLTHLFTGVVIKLLESIWTAIQHFSLSSFIYKSPIGGGSGLQWKRIYHTTHLSHCLKWINAFGAAGNAFWWSPRTRARTNCNRRESNWLTISKLCWNINEDQFLILWDGTLMMVLISSQGV